MCVCARAQSSVLGSGFGELGGPKLGQSAGAQILEQLKGPGLGPLPTQPPSSSGANHTPVVGGLGGTAGPAAPPPSSTMVSSSWDVKPPVTQASMAMPSQFSRESQTHTHTQTH